MAQSIAFQSCQGISPSGEKASFNLLPNIGQKFKEENFSPEITNIICKGWAPATIKQYKSYLTKWVSFCQQHNQNTVKADLNFVLLFLMELHNKGASYCAINTAKSALFSTISVVNHPEWHKHEAVCKFMKGIWKSAPPTPKYTKTWNVDKVIKYIKTHLANNVSLSLKQLTIKSVFLVAITSGQRGQAIHLMHLDNLTKCENKRRYIA